jgi:predicted MFS family arabinose efflux permease
LTVAVTGLGVTQIIAWGSIYYALAVVGPSITREFGWNPQWTYVGFSLALLVAGVVAPLTGRLLDRYGGRVVMSAGSVVAAVGLALLARCDSFPTYLAAWAVLGFAKAMVLYEAAFATLAQTSIAKARRAITYLSFYGGLASTFSWPITRALHDSIGWRDTYLVYAGLALVVCLPIHLLALPAPLAAAEPVPAATGTGEAPRELSAGFLALAFGLLSTSFAMTAFMWSGISVHLLSMLDLLGFAVATGVAIGSIIGPSQVLGRIGDMLFGGHFHPLQVLRVSSTLLPCAFAMLFIGSGHTIAAVMFAILYGVSIGMNTIARGAVPLALFGPKGYGARLGRLAAPSFIAEATAPVIYAAVIGWYGPWGGLAIAGAASTLAWVGVLLLSIAYRREIAAVGAAPD